jgi:hypothetical protein
MNKSVLWAAGLGVLCALAALTMLAAPDGLGHVAQFVLSPETGLAMTTLAANAERRYVMGDNADYPMIADDIIFQGAAVGENGSGYSRPLQAGDPFQGFAEAKVDNTGGSAGDLDVHVKTKGRVQLAVAGATDVTANDRPLVYASDDNTFTLTASTNSPIGTVLRWISSGVAVVEFDAQLASEIRLRVAGDV